MDISSLRERDNVVTFTVSELNGYIKSVFENNRTLSSVTVKGEISNFTAHRSGHLYFSLKDAEGQIRAVMFRSSASRLKFMPESGMRVIVHGAVTVYPRDGSYQIYVSSMQPDGIGALYLAYEQLKEKLFAEGLFDATHKLPIPKIPEKIGVITSPTGAAVRDIINVTGRRFPLADLYIFPSLVQGDGAEDNLIRAIDYFDKSGLVDVVIIGRGGGSIEDLWAFNSERLARRIFKATVPVISAVGHETDFTICDFVSDLRAPTPSAAAELAVPDIREINLRIDDLADRCVLSLERSLERAKERLIRASKSYVFESPESLTEACRLKINDLKSSAVDALNSVIRGASEKLSINAEKLSVLSPLAVLSRGYSITEHNGKNLKRAQEVKAGDELSIRLNDGSLSAKVTSVFGGVDNE